MIVLDTNQVDNLSDALYLMLQQIGARSGHGLALPEMVFEETLAHYEHEVDRHISTARRALRALSALGAEPAAEVVLPTVTQSTIARRTLLQQRFTILPTPPEAPMQALIREARRQRPADTDWHGKKGAGARDALIWLTVLARATETGEEILFVTADGDFSDRRGALHPELADELLDRGIDEASLVVHKSVIELLDRFAVKSGLAEDFDFQHATWLDVKFHVEAEALGGGLATIRELQQDGIEATVRVQLREIHTEKRGPAQAYDIGEQKWISVQCRWTGLLHVVLLRPRPDGASPFPVRLQPAPFMFDGTCLARLTPEGTLADLATVIGNPVVFDENRLVLQT